MLTKPLDVLSLSSFFTPTDLSKCSHSTGGFFVSAVFSVRALARSGNQIPLAYPVDRAIERGDFTSRLARRRLPTGFIYPRLNQNTAAKEVKSTDIEARLLHSEVGNQIARSKRPSTLDRKEIELSEAS